MTFNKISKALLLSTIIIGSAFAYSNPEVFASDPKGSWQTGSPMPTAVEGYGAAKVGEIHYYIAGYHLGDTNLNQRYDQSSDTWLANGAPIPGPPRSETAAVSHGGKIYVAGGRAFGVLDDIERYDPTTNSWTTLATMSTGVATEHQVVIHGDKIYVVGGRLTTIPLGIATNALQIYDIPSNTWSMGASLPSPRSDGVAMVHGDKIFLFGGWNGTSIQSTVLIYDISSNSWSTGASMPSGSADPAGGLCGDKMHVMGGLAPPFGPLTGLHFVYDPAHNSWTTSTAMPTSQITGETQGISDAGQIFIVGGGIFGSGSFNPTQNIWKCG